MGHNSPDYGIIQDFALAQLSRDWILDLYSAGQTRAALLLTASRPAMAAHAHGHAFNRQLSDQI